MRNHVMRHAFEALPQSVLSTNVGRMVFRSLQRNVGNNNKGNRKGTSKGGTA